MTPAATRSRAPSLSAVVRTMCSPGCGNGMTTIYCFRHATIHQIDGDITFVDVQDHHSKCSLPRSSVQATHIGKYYVALWLLNTEHY